MQNFFEDQNRHIVASFITFKESFLDLIQLISTKAPQARVSHSNKVDLFVKTLVKDSMLQGAESGPLEVMISKTLEFFGLLSDLVTEALDSKPQTYIINAGMITQK